MLILARKNFGRCILLSAFMSQSWLSLNIAPFPVNMVTLQRRRSHLFQNEWNDASDGNLTFCASFAICVCIPQWTQWNQLTISLLKAKECRCTSQHCSLRDFKSSTRVSSNSVRHNRSSLTLQWRATSNFDQSPHTGSLIFGSSWPRAIYSPCVSKPIQLLEATTDK